MSSYTHPVPRAIPEALRHVAWFALVCGVAFVIPYLGVSVLDLQHDVFYLVYFAVTIALVATYVRVERVDVGEIFRERWRWSLGVGVVVGGLPRLQRLQDCGRERRGRTARTSSSSCSGAVSATD